MYIFNFRLTKQCIQILIIWQISVKIKEIWKKMWNLLNHQEISNLSNKLIEDILLTMIVITISHQKNSEYFVINIIYNSFNLKSLK
jgi:hypothetical protein